MHRVIITLALAMAGCTPNGLDLRQSVIFAGDSFTYGTINDATIPPKPGGGNYRCYQDLCWASLIGEALDESGIHWTNKGVGGSTSRDWDPNDHSPVFAYPAANGEGLFSLIPAGNVAFIMLGVNDARGVFEPDDFTPVEEFAGHILDIVLTLRVRGFDRFVLATQPSPLFWAGTAEGDRLLAYSEEVRRIAAGHPWVTLVDLDKDFPSYGFDPDGIHPNILGNAYMAEMLRPALLGVIQ